MPWRRKRLPEFAGDGDPIPIHHNVTEEVMTCDLLTHFIIYVRFNVLFVIQYYIYA